MKCPNCGEEMKTETVSEGDPGLDICEGCGYAYDHKEEKEAWIPEKNKKRKASGKNDSAFGLPAGRFR